MSTLFGVTLSILIFITKIAFRGFFKTFRYKEAQKLFSLHLCGKFL